MSFQLSAGSVNILEMQVSANTLSGIAWYPFNTFLNINSSGTYEYVYILDTNAASATYVVDPSITFEWGISSNIENTNFINITAFNDASVITICAVSYAHEVNSVLLCPYYTQLSTISTSQLSASVSAFYMQVSTGNAMYMPDGMELNWNTQALHDNTYAGFMGGENLTDMSTDIQMTGYATSATKNTFTYNGSGTDEEIYIFAGIINDKYSLSPLSSRFVHYDQQILVTLNPKIRADIIEENTTSIILCAVTVGNSIPSSTNIIWDINNRTSNIGLTGGALNSPYIFGNSSTSLGMIKISALDLTNYYVYSLSAFTGIDTGIFRPYNNITELSQLSARVINLPEQANTYRYSIQALGITNGTPHIMAPYQYIRWGCSDINIEATLMDGNSIYTFNTDDISSNIDCLNLRIVPPVVTSSPKTCSVNLQLYTLTGSKFEDGIYNEYDFTITYNEWLSNDIFNPKFRFQYETEDQNVIYRPTSGTVIYQISNTSLLPEETYGLMVYTFNNGICSIPYDIRNNSPAPSAFTYQFDTTSQVICTIEMMVYAFAEGYSDYAIRSATTKRIIFADVPNISNFNIRPEWRWDGSDWEQVVESKQTNSGTILVASPTLSAYGLCHTENFFLSTSEAGEQYIWSMQDINYPELQEQTITTAPTAWISFKTGPNSSYISICASVFSGLISSTMPVLYYDTPQGTRFTNFATTYDSTTSDLKQHIKIIGIQDLSLHIELTGTNQLQYPVPNYYYLSGIYTALDNTSLFDEYVSVYYFNLSSVFWNDQVRSNNISNNLATASVYLNEDNIGESRFGVPSNEITKINITPEIEYTLQLKKNHPSANDWCFSSITDINSSSSITITAYPMTPSIYTSNRFILTGVNIQYQNMVQCFSGVDELNWNDRDNILTVNTCIPYTTSYDSVGNYDLGLTNTYRINGLTGTLVSEFKDIVNISNQYISYDPEISRVFGKTKLSFPYTLDNCKMPPNEWVTEDTFNSVINKLYSNLEYLENMSKLYDIPPTSYIGWYGTIYYNNSTMRTRWFTNTPHNSYKYDHPEIAIDGMFNNLQSCFVRDNIMYLSNGTTVYILSSDFWGTEISLRDYKTLGDDFTNIKAISLDSQGRIYLLDTSNQYYSSKNRVIVYSYNAISDQWQLMYEWGGLGGLNAKNKFNSPNDLFIDDSDNVWVADTFNKCIKKYTRTGSWLKTITSEYFTETEQPLSVITNAEYIYVLTNSQIVCFNSNGMYVDKYNIATGAKRICKCRDGGFLYILYTNEIVKYTLTGIEAGVIEPTNFVSYTADFRCVFHDEYRNLYIINKNHILKYVDQLSITNLKTDTFDQGWPLEKLHVHKDEYIQDWIINRCFQRLWDNIEIFRRSLNGKFGYQTFQSTTLMSFITTIQPPDNFDYCKYDWLYDQGIAVEQNVTFEYQKPVVRTFNIDEFRDLPYEKNMICIGINELHSSDVYNRVITKLFECENTILQMIDD